MILWPLRGTLVVPMHIVGMVMDLRDTPEIHRTWPILVVYSLHNFDNALHIFEIDHGSLGPFGEASVVLGRGVSTRGVEHIFPYI